jgi:hypothetical protein
MPAVRSSRVSSVGSATPPWPACAEAEVAKLPEAGRAACHNLWTQVDALLGDLASPANLSAW